MLKKTWMRKYAIGMGLLCGLLVFAANFRGSGAGHAFGYGLATCLGIIVMGYICAWLFFEEDKDAPKV